MSALFPHLPYAEAVYADLAGAGMRPPLIEVERAGSRLLILLASWPAGHTGISREVWPHGMYLRWSHPVGWWLSGYRDMRDMSLLPIDALAAPAAVTEIALYLVGLGPAGTRQPGMPRPTGRWDRARELDRGLAEWESREDTRD